MPALQYKDLKVKLLESGDFKLFLKEKDVLHKLGIEDLYDPDYYVGWEEDELKACFQLCHQRYQRRSKVNKWFNYWLKQKNKQLFFITFTFNDKAMEGSSYSRQRYVNKNVNPYYDFITNIDYGDETDREHYHAVVVMDPEAEELMDWKYSKGKKHWYCNDCPLFNDKKGEVHIQKVESGDPIRLKKYQSKLTSHALKNDCTRLGFKRESEYQKTMDSIRYHTRRVKAERRGARLVKGAT